MESRNRMMMRIRDATDPLTPKELGEWLDAQRAAAPEPPLLIQGMSPNNYAHKAIVMSPQRRCACCQRHEGLIWMQGEICPDCLFSACAGVEYEICRAYDPYGYERDC